MCCRTRRRICATMLPRGRTGKILLAGLGKAGTLPLKLFQPVHSRFYIITASLNCRMPGLPDHTVNPTQGESVGFVVRQLRPNPGYLGCRLRQSTIRRSAANMPGFPSLARMAHPARLGDQPEWVPLSQPIRLPVW